MCVRVEPNVGGWPTVRHIDWCGRWSNIPVPDPGPGAPGAPGVGFDSLTQLAYDTATTTGRQSIIVRSIPVPLSAVYIFSVFASFLNSNNNEAGMHHGRGAIARGGGSIFRPTAINVVSTVNLVGTSLDIVANTFTQMADITITGPVAGLRVLDWHVWTVVHKSVGAV